jgi:hypothetical protein
MEPGPFRTADPIPRFPTGSAPSVVYAAWVRIAQWQVCDLDREHRLDRVVPRRTAASPMCKVDRLTAGLAVIFGRTGQRSLAPDVGGDPAQQQPLRLGTMRSDDRRPGSGGHLDRAVPHGTDAQYRFALIKEHRTPARVNTETAFTQPRARRPRCKSQKPRHKLAPACSQR